MKTRIFIGLIIVLVLFSGCTQPSPSTGQPGNNGQPSANTSPPPASTPVCPQGLDAWASKTQFGNPATQFSSSDNIFIIVQSEVGCRDRAKATLFDASGNLVSTQEYNIPKDATGYNDYNPNKNLAAGNYAFEIKYANQTIKTIPIAIAAAEEKQAPLSEQPDTAKFNEYFTRVYLGKLPLGVQVGPPDNFPVKTSVFTSQDQFCTDFTIIKTIPAGSIGSATYSTDKNDYTRPKSNFPIELKQGGSSGCEPLDYAPGKYEYKIYIDDVLVSVLPFEVK
ncbi:MAG: hypothetical protein PHH08_03105 [Candidatus ainarchaeum sp.]|nr:hypothetical protein [Candidatus ainarchaeum sp.]